MSDAGLHRLLLITDALPTRARIWGTGGWQMPEEREALDWLTLARLLGWQVSIARPGKLTGLTSAHWIVVACDSALLPVDDVARIERRLAAAPGLLVARAAKQGAPLARLMGSAGETVAKGARAITWPRADGTSGHALLKKPLPLVSLPDGNVWAKIGRLPLVVLRPLGRGYVATLAVHPSVLRDASGAGTALLSDMLVSAAGRPVAWLDWQGTVALRMDDPGAAQNVWLESWAYPKLHAPAWKKVGAILARHKARLSIAYVSGWVDDGDPARGTLTVGGQHPDRHPGGVYPSPEIVYRDRHGHRPGTRHDGPSEYRGIQDLRQRGLADVELHGHTHMHPDSEAWAAAPDRYTSVGWFREVGRAALPILAARGAKNHPLTIGRASLQQQFKTTPLALVSPGDEFTDAAIERALDLDIELVSSYYTAIRHDGRFAWSTHLCAPYLDEPDTGWFAGNLPVVGYFHDRDLAVHGIDWLERNLSAWRAAGATRFVDFRELVAALELKIGTQDTSDGVAVTVDLGATPLPRAARLRVYDPHGLADVIVKSRDRMASDGQTGDTMSISVGP